MGRKRYSLDIEKNQCAGSQFCCSLRGLYSQVSNGAVLLEGEKLVAHIRFKSLQKR